MLEPRKYATRRSKIDVKGNAGHEATYTFQGEPVEAHTIPIFCTQ